MSSNSNLIASRRRSPARLRRCRKRKSWRSAMIGRRRRSLPFPNPLTKGLTAYYPFDGDLTDASGFHHDGKAVRGEVVL